MEQLGKVTQGQSSGPLWGGIYRKKEGREGGKEEGKGKERQKMEGRGGKRETEMEMAKGVEKNNSLFFFSKQQKTTVPSLSRAFL